MLSQLVAFLPVVSLLVLVPGANNLLVIRTAAEVGTGAARTVTAGTSLGIVTWATAVAAGVGGLVAALPGGLGTLQVAGSGLMIATGLWAVVPRRPRGAASRSSAGFLSGLAVCLANPRTPLTAVSLLPQFALADASTTSTIILGAEWALVAGLWNVVCVGLTRGRVDGGRGRQVARLGGVMVCAVGVWGLLA